MRNDFDVIVEQGNMGLGFKNTINFEKSQFAETTYKKKIWDLTAKEVKLSVDLFNDLVKRKLRG